MGLETEELITLDPCIHTHGERVNSSSMIMYNFSEIIPIAKKIFREPTKDMEKG